MKPYCLGISFLLLGIKPQQCTLASTGLRGLPPSTSASSSPFTFSCTLSLTRWPFFSHLLREPLWTTLFCAAPCTAVTHCHIATLRGPHSTWRYLSIYSPIYYLIPFIIPKSRSPSPFPFISQFTWLRSDLAGSGDLSNDCMSLF